MPDISVVLDCIKKAAVDAVEHSKPFSHTFGTVVAVDPLVIRIGPSLEIGKSNLILTGYVHNAGLQADDRVLMLRTCGGQRYILLDKVVDNVTSSD